MDSFSRKTGSVVIQIQYKEHERLMHTNSYVKYLYSNSHLLIYKCKWNKEVIIARQCWYGLSVYTHRDTYCKNSLLTSARYSLMGATSTHLICHTRWGHLHSLSLGQRFLAVTNNFQPNDRRARRRAGWSGGWHRPLGADWTSELSLARRPQASHPS